MHRAIVRGLTLLLRREVETVFLAKLFSVSPSPVE